jgi:hypothetical protein
MAQVYDQEDELDTPEGVDRFARTIEDAESYANAQAGRRALYLVEKILDTVERIST